MYTWSRQLEEAQAVRRTRGCRLHCIQEPHEEYDVWLCRIQTRDVWKSHRLVEQNLVFHPIQIFIMFRTPRSVIVGTGQVGFLRLDSP